MKPTLKQTILFAVYAIVFNLLLLPIYLLMMDMSQQAPGAGIQERINAFLLVFLPFFVLPTIVIFSIKFVVQKIYRKYSTY